jgi:hypothetical protein
MSIPLFKSENIYNIFMGKRISWKEGEEEKTGTVVGVSLMGMLTIYGIDGAIATMQCVG